MGVDRAVFNAFNSIAHRWPVVDVIIQVFMNDYVLTTALGLVPMFLWFSGGRRQRERHQWALFHAILAVAMGNGVVKALNLLYYRHRPFAFEPVRRLFYRPSDSSFPSNAAMVGFAMATAVWHTNRGAGVLMGIMAALLGMARICGGVHFPSDILGGSLIGVGAALFVVRRLGRMDQVWATATGIMRRLLLA
jgi:undecaprenyl-diphosphatase